MALIGWLKRGSVRLWLGIAAAALTLLKLALTIGEKLGKAKLRADQAEDRIEETQKAKQDYNDAKAQTDDSLADRLTRNK